MPINGNHDHERGNVFFTLFGAVALVGVIGAASSTLMRGPLSTMVIINARTKADAQMQMAAKLAMTRAAQESGAGWSDGDCDNDTIVEPLPPDAMAGLTGGGALPATLGAAQADPWKSKYGYCAWDLGTLSCGTAGLLDGGADSTAPSGDPVPPVFVILSAGPDRVFQTKCHAWTGDPATNTDDLTAGGIIEKTPSSDDFMIAYSYAEAVEASDGLWSIKNPGTITTDNDLEISSDTTFASGTTSFASGTTQQFSGAAQFSASSRLDLGAGGLFNLPNQLALPNCNLANDGALRINNTADNVLQICDKDTGWSDIGGPGATVSASGSPGEIQYNSGGALAGATGLVWFTSGGQLGIGTNPTEKLDVNGAARVRQTLQVNQSADIDQHLTIGTYAEADRFQFSSGTGMEVTGGKIVFDLSGTEEVVFEPTGNVGIGVADPNSALDVAGDADISGEVFGNRFLAYGSGGSAALPSFSFSGSSSTGMYYSSGLGFAIGGSNEALLTASELSVGGAGDFAGSVEGDAFRFNAAPTTGLFYASGSNLALQLGGTGRLLVTPSGNVEIPGNVGIGTSNPDTQLDVDGAIKVGDDSSACSGPFHGAIRFSSSGDKLELCSTGNAWVTIGTSGGGGAGTGSLWTNNTTYITRGTFNVINSAQALPAALDDAGDRAFWYPNKSSFRAGGVTAATPWADAAIGNYSIGMGLDTQAAGIASIALGQSVSVTGANAFGFGLGAAGADPMVSGDSSLGIFMGDQSGADIADDNTMALLGGKFLIDESGTEMGVSGTLSLDVEGSVGALNYCDEDGVNCFTATDIAGGAPGNDREVIFNSGGQLWTDTNLVFTTAGRLGIGDVSPETQLDVNGTIQIADGGEVCAAGLAGGIRYGSASLFYCDGTAWQNIFSSGGGAGTMWINDLADALTDYGAILTLGLGNGALDSNTTGTSNTAVGISALTANTTGADNTAVGRGVLAASNANGNTGVGRSALTSTTSGTNNTAVGAYALFTNTTGVSNSAFGFSALDKNVSGNDNTAFGQHALYNNTTGGGSSAFGNFALINNTTGADNVAIGYAALYSNVANRESIAIGPDAMRYANSTATGAVTYNTAVGAYALRGSTTAAANTGTHNTALGHSTLIANTTGDRNTAVGALALIANTTGTHNTVVGAHALDANTFGHYNVAIGADALGASVSPDNNVAIGVGALGANLTSDNNIAVGTSALALATGANNTALGKSAGDAITSGTNNIAIGFDADVLSPTGSNQMSIGNTIYADTSTDFVTIGGTNAPVSRMIVAPPATQTIAAADTITADACGSIKPIQSTGAVTTNTTDTITSPTAAYAGCCMDIVNVDTADTITLDDNAKFLTAAAVNVALAPNDAVRVCTNGTNWYQVEDKVTAVGAVAINDLTDAATDYATNHTMYLGTGVGAANTGLYNTALGDLSFQGTGAGGLNTALGYASLRNNSSGTHNTATGVEALLSNTTGTTNTASGYVALYANTVGTGNTAIGAYALNTNVTQSENTAIGLEALRYADSTTTPGISYNTAVGAYALRGSTTSSANTGGANAAVGHRALTNNTSGGNNVAFGSGSLRNNTTGDVNVSLGSNSMQSNTTGTRNVAVGYHSLDNNVTKTDSTAIGFDAMRYADSAAGAAITYNTALGAYALRGSTTASANTGTHNTALGHSALFSNTTGERNTVVGAQAFISNTTGTHNTVVGAHALDTNTIGLNNVAVGADALGANIDGDSNTALGTGALATNTANNNSTAVGNSALFLATGADNTALGKSAGANITTGASNIIIGASNNAPNATASNQLDIGDTIYADMATDKVGIGTAAPQSTLHIPDGGYLQAEDNNAGAPPAADCDADAERGRLSIDTTNNRLYVCNGATRGWDYVALTN